LDLYSPGSFKAIVFTDVMLQLCNRNHNQKKMKILLHFSLLTISVSSQAGNNTLTKEANFQVIGTKLVAKTDRSLGFAVEIFPAPPSTGTYILKSVNGIPSWSAP